MAPFIPNGVYKIRNVAFPSIVASMVSGVQQPIMGLNDNPTIGSDKWRIINIGGGGNEVYIQNADTGTYASAQQFPDAQLFGSYDSLIWTVVKEDRGYYLQSPNAKYVWWLTEDRVFAPIKLSDFTAKDDTKWTFDRIGN
ncbi:hypothetical protein L210DRAFT_3645726 [Boletus edulis BED1]|uniref:Ricin B lectin domain-containing protein n=1 Tax=Boletus edulis BED1 TaxID=1328754 RepID=A0AAD4BFY3_BOLED|nr:hypothetical protein L210DRAFT_947872 [Boletus edulis BED1]KAF8439718.1 hypothetical protein L210DRAFT_3645726 [Boletus edulis BED1]